MFTICWIDTGLNFISLILSGSCFGLSCVKYRGMLNANFTWIIQIVYCLWSNYVFSRWEFCFVNYNFPDNCPEINVNILFLSESDSILQSHVFQSHRLKCISVHYVWFHKSFAFCLNWKYKNIHNLEDIVFKLFYCAKHLCLHSNIFIWMNKLMRLPYRILLPELQNCISTAQNVLAWILFLFLDNSEQNNVGLYSVQVLIENFAYIQTFVIWKL